MDFKDPCNLVQVEAELCPGAIKQWLSIIKDGKKMEKGNRDADFTTKVKKHLSALGWVFSYAHKGKKRELRYKSPNGRWFYSLASACMSLCTVDDEEDSRKQQQIVPKDDLSCSPRNLSLESCNFVGINPSVVDSLKTDPNFDVLKTKRKRVEDSGFNGETPNEEKTKRVKNCDTAVFNGETPDSVKIVSSVDVSNQNQKKERNRVEDCDINGATPSDEKNNLCDSVPNFDELKKKRKRVKDCDDTAAFNCSTPKEEEKNQNQNRSSDDFITIVLNIDASDDVEYKRRKRVDTAAFQPRIGKSLRKILQVMDERKKKKKEEKESLRLWRKDCGAEMNCDVCCVCHFGGELLLCDGCPSAFHHTCLGLSSLPEEDLWFCPCCCCDICKSIESSSSENSLLMSCQQCQRRFHLKCLEEKKGSSSVVSLRGWFCTSQCDRVFTELQSLVGCKISLGDDLVWTLMRAPSEYEHFDDEKNSKLDSAVEILHQGFEPTKDPFSGKDLVEEMILRRDGGFYTVIVERKNDPVTVAAVRVGKDEAEIPLVATTWNHRRSGMCRLLMDELERQMCGMGVSRLVLPAATEVLTTWTQRFGFSVMESRERLEVVKHGMLDFVGTVMCHKFLMFEKGEQEDSPESSLTE